MARSNQGGFTLIELILVMAITGALVVIAFQGQRGLRSQAQFDADVDKLVASIAEIRNESTAGLNNSTAATAGTGVNACPSGGSAQTVFAGEAFVASNALPPPGSPFEVDYYKANPAAACTFETRRISVPSGLQVSGTGGRELFVRTANGGLDVCPWSDLTPGTELTFFQNASCTPGTWTFNLQDADGHKSQITIDQSGLAKRLN